MANSNFNVSSSSIVHAQNSLVLSLGSNFAQNHVIGQGRIITGSPAPTIGVQPNNLFVPQRGPGQIALGQRLSKVSRTQISSLRVRIHTIVEYLPAEQTRIEALPGLHPTSGYTVTEVPNTAGRFLPPPAPRELLLAPNHNNIPSPKPESK